MSDRLALADAIEDAGIPRDKAQRVASVIFDAIHDNVATKADVQAEATALPFRQVRRRFLVALWQELRVVWPVVSGLVALQLVLGAFISLLQGWPLGDAFYFTFVTALTIGYGDLVPKGVLARLLAMVIGFTGILLMGLVAAVGVRALQSVGIRSRGASSPASPLAPRRLSRRSELRSWSDAERLCGYDHDERVFEIPVPLEKIAQARVLAQVPETDPNMVGSYPLTKEAVSEIVDLPPGFSAIVSTYVLEADR